MPVRPESPPLAAWWDELEQIRLDVRELTAGLAPDQWAWRPAPGKWSIAECIDHLSVTGTAAGRYQRDALEANRARTGHGPFSLGIFGRWMVRMVGPNPKRPMPGPAVFAPRSDLVPATVLADFEATQDLLQGLVADSEGVDLGAIRARSAASTLIRINLAAWFTANIAHEHRHLQQIRGLLAHPAFPSHSIEHP